MQEIALVARLPVLLVLGLLLGAASSMLLPEDMAPYVVEFCIGSLVVAALLWTAYSVVKWVTANNRVETPLDLLSYHIGGALQPVIVLGVSALLMGATFLVSGLVGWASAFLEAGWFSLWVALESTAKIVEGVRFIPVLASSLLAFLLTGCLVWLIVLCSTRVELPEIAQILGKDIKEPGPSFLYHAIGLTMFGIWVMYNQVWGGDDAVHASDHPRGGSHARRYDGACGGYILCISYVSQQKSSYYRVRRLWMYPVPWHERHG